MRCCEMKFFDVAIFFRGCSLKIKKNHPFSMYANSSEKLYPFSKHAKSGNLACFTYECVCHGLAKVDRKVLCPF